MTSWVKEQHLLTLLKLQIWPDAMQQNPFARPAIRQADNNVSRHICICICTVLKERQYLSPNNAVFCDGTTTGDRLARSRILEYYATVHACTIHAVAATCCNCIIRASANKLESWFIGGVQQAMQYYSVSQNYKISGTNTEHDLIRCSSLSCSCVSAVEQADLPKFQWVHALPLLSDTFAVHLPACVVMLSVVITLLCYISHLTTTSCVCMICKVAGER